MVHSTSYCSAFKGKTHDPDLRLSASSALETVCCPVIDQLEDSRVKVIKPIAERFIKWCNTGVEAKPDFEDALRVQELIEIARGSNSKF